MRPVPFPARASCASETRCHVMEREEGCLSEIAHAFGFSSHAHFTSAFRLEFGVTPSRARRMGRAPKIDPVLERD